MDLKSRIMDILFDLQFSTGAYDVAEGYTTGEARECAYEDIMSALKDA